MSKRPKPRYQEKMEYRAPEKHFNILPKNRKQDVLIEAIKNFPIVVTIGCAGTGKTYCSAGTAAMLYMQGKFDKIVLTRANVATGKSLGHFPGDIKEKMTPWLLPMLEVLKKALGSNKFAYMMEKELIEIQPIETIRGRSYEKSIILVDEAQNLEMDEIKAVTTRIGEGSTLVLMGDPAQSDVKRGEDLLRFAKLISNSEIDLPVVQFGVHDIVRSDIVADLVKLYIRENI